MTAVLAPPTVGLLLGLEALGGMLAGATLSGVLLALLMANAGGAWDNANSISNGAIWEASDRRHIKPPWWAIPLATLLKTPPGLR